MLYLDSSLLVKRYLRERGWESVNARFGTNERIFTSALSYAEVQAALGRKLQQRDVDKKGHKRARDKFLQDWFFH